MKSTSTGKLNLINKCQLVIPMERNQFGSGNTPTARDGFAIGRLENDEYIITMNNLPDISDTKSAVYNNEPIIGRSTPLYTYSHSGDRTIAIQIHFFMIRPGDAEQNLEALRAIQSALYPRQDTTKRYPYIPPPICRIKCGSLLSSGSDYICAVLQSYNVKFPTDVAWDEPELSSAESSTYCPYRFDVDTNWLVVYSTEDLPFQRRIYTSGR